FSHSTHSFDCRFLIIMADTLSTQDSSKINSTEGAENVIGSPSMVDETDSTKRKKTMDSGAAGTPARRVTRTSTKSKPDEIDKENEADTNVPDVPNRRERGRKSSSKTQSPAKSQTADINIKESAKATPDKDNQGMGEDAESQHHPMVLPGNKYLNVEAESID